jgi:transcriptional regulator NrdR family protein
MLQTKTSGMRCPVCGDHTLVISVRLDLNGSLRRRRCCRQCRHRFTTLESPIRILPGPRAKVKE